MENKLHRLEIKRPDGGLVLRYPISSLDDKTIGCLCVQEGKLVLEATVGSIIPPDCPIIGDLNFSVSD